MNRIRYYYKADFLHRKKITGKGITVAVLDTGIYPHRDLKKNSILSLDFINAKPKYDDNSHGTHVCGIIAGNGEMSRGLYKGIAPEASLISLKVLGRNGTGSAENIIKGIHWIIENHRKYNIKVVNISIGMESESCSDEDSELVKMVDAMWDEGITVLASAGNNGPTYHSITTPGISRKIITVGTYDNMKHVDNRGKEHVTYSGKGPTHCNIAKPDIVTKGAHIVSCHASYNGYIAKSGTSMSTPIVSGAAALVFSYDNYLTNDEFKNLLCLSSRDIGLDRYTQGCGELDIIKLISLI